MPEPLVRRQFGPNARHYAECEVHRSGESLQRLVDLTSPRSDWRVLDVATGAGHTAAIFSPHVAEVVASDITPEMLGEAEKLARAKGLANLHTAAAEAADLGFETESFDLVTCRLAAHHFPDVAGFVREAHRVLKSGGLLAVVDNVVPDQQQLPDLCAEAVEAAAADYNAFEKRRDPSHARALAVEEWLQIMRDTGFTVSSQERIDKEMAFIPWLERMGCDRHTARELEDKLREASPLSRFLRPRDIDGALHFTLQEFIIVAAKAG